MKYSIGVQSFEKIIEDGYIYVDKTDLVYRLVKDGKVYFLNRPRRFGKSLLISTLENYFLGRKELFKGLKIDALEKDWFEYPVFKLSFGSSDYMKPTALDDAIGHFVRNAEKRFGITPDIDSYGIRFADVLKTAHEKTGRKAVVLIDEYDKPLLDVMDCDEAVMDINGNKKRIEDYNRNVLKAFYGVFKDADEHLQFVFLTGVTKFSQISVFSGFNQPKDISMDRRYEALCGITTEELLSIFDEPIRELAEEEGVEYTEMVDRLKRKYDGYHFGDNMTDIYNPFSLLNCFDSMKLYNYWFASGTPTYLVRLLQHCDENINELAGRYYDVSQFVNYKADVQRPLPMIYQSGYLTIKAYRRDMNIYLLDFPNEEVRSGFIDVLSADYFKGREDPRSWLNEVTDYLRLGNVEGFMTRMTSLLSSATYRFQRKQDEKECERYFQYSFYLILQMLAHYSVIAEKETSQGRIDCVVEYPEYVYIMEFKLNGCASAALQQIKDKGYAKPYRSGTRKVVCIGINFSSETGTVESYEKNYE